MDEAIASTAESTKSITASADFFRRFVLAENFRLRCFDKPVAIIAPDEIVKTLRDGIELIFAIRRFDCVDRLVQSRENFDGVDRQRRVVDLRRGIARSVHLPKARGIPKFCRKVSAFFDLFFIEADVLTARRDAHETKAQPVGAILVDQLQRVGRVAERLRHFAALLVTNQAREKNIVKWNVVFDHVRICPA